MIASQMMMAERRRERNSFRGEHPPTILPFLFLLVSQLACVCRFLAACLPSCELARARSVSDRANGISRKY
jgi:hypothetical protein